MPIYEYCCANCGTSFEALRSIREADAPLPCKHCQSSDTHRKLSVFYAQSGGRQVAGASQSCSGCQGGSCSSCGSRH